jgi:methyl-accepting chemotaxis protein
MLRSISHRHPRRQVTSVSVRARIIAIALIPVLGFLVNGAAFTSGNTAAADAFNSVKSAATLSDTSREVKTGVARMQLAAKEFVSRPSDKLSALFAEGHELSLNSLNAISGILDLAQRDEIAPVRQKLEEMKLNFDELGDEQLALGFTANDGTRKLLEDSGSLVEKTINDNMHLLSGSDRVKLLVAMSNLRRFEAQYRQNSQQSSWDQFFEEYRSFGEMLRDSTISPGVKDQRAMGESW